MKLDKKKELVARTLGVGKKRIWFNPARLTEIKEAITKQDIGDLVKDKAIVIKPITGKRKKTRRKRRRGEGKIKKKVKRRKREYIILIRKLRRYLKNLKERGVIDIENYHKLRKYAKSGIFQSLKSLKEHVALLEKEGKIKKVASISKEKIKIKKSTKNKNKNAI